MEAIQNQWDELLVAASRAWDDAKRGAERATLQQKLLVGVGVVMSVAGAAAQVIVINQWLTHFPKSVHGWPGGGPLAVLVVSSLSLLAIFGVSFALWCLWRRPRLAGFRNPLTFGYSAACGAAFAANGYLIIFSTPNVPEILQALLVSSQPIWTLLFAALSRQHDSQSYLHVLVVASIALSTGGIVLGGVAVSHSARSVSAFPDVGTWSFLFALGVVPAALSNVLTASYYGACADAPQERYGFADDERRSERFPSVARHAEDGEVVRSGVPSMHDVTGAGGEDRGSRRGGDGGGASTSASVSRSASEAALVADAAAAAAASDRVRARTRSSARGRASRSDDPAASGERFDRATSKLVFLVLSSFFQLLFVAAFGPVDWAPFFGPDANNATAAMKSLSNGVRCTFNALPGGNVTCASNLHFYLGFAAAYATTNAGAVIVNAFSAPLSSLVSQLASPVAAVVLVAAPSWAPKPLIANVGELVGAILLLVAASCVFATYEVLMGVRRREEPAPHFDEVSSYGTIEA
jgi:hypothetical protein